MTLARFARQISERLTVQVRLAGGIGHDDLGQLVQPERFHRVQPQHLAPGD
jgi:hypothetical protein